MRNNFEILSNKKIIKNYYDENVFENESTIYNSDILKDTIIEELQKMKSMI